MFGRLALCGAAAIALVTVMPAHSSAKGFLGGSMHHAGAFHFHFNRHGYLPRFSHRSDGHRHNGKGYSYGDAHAYWPLHGSGDPAPEPIVVPLAYPIYAGPRCVHSVETVIVPAELGGGRAIRITRC